MKRLILILIVSIWIIPIVDAQTLDEILEEHFAVMGQENLIKVTTLKMTAKSISGPNEFPVTIYAKRPDRIRIEVDVQGQILIQALDGDSAWSVVPWSGSTDPVDIIGPQLKGLVWLADLDGSLYNYQDKGFTAELLEDDNEFEGTEVFKIRLEDEEGDKLTYVIDAESYVLLARIINMKIQGQDIEQASVYSGYEMKDGIAWSMEEETQINGQTQRQSKTESIEINPEIDDAIFVKPEVKKEEVVEEEPVEEDKN